MAPLTPEEILDFCIERFGRFPHRNAILGRASTAAEIEYLKSNAESFGQKAAQ